MRAVAVLFLALGCQGTSGGILPDAREVDAAIDPCADMNEWSTRPVRFIAPYERLPGAIAVDEAYVYWTEPLDCGLENGCVAAPILRRAPLASGEPEDLLAGQMDQPGRLAATRDYLFVSVGADLWRLQKDGTAPEVVGVVGTAAELAADADAIYYWDGAALVRVAADTLEATPLGEAQNLGSDFQLAGAALWWLQPAPVEIWRMPLASGTAELAAQIPDSAGSSLAVDGLGRAFLATSSPGDPQVAPVLVRLVADGAQPEPMVELYDHNHAIAVDDVHVHWLEPSAQRLSRMPLDGGCIETRDLDATAAVMAATPQGIVAAADGIVVVER